MSCFLSLAMHPPPPPSLFVGYVFGLSPNHDTTTEGKKTEGEAEENLITTEGAEKGVKRGGGSFYFRRAF